MELYAGYGSSPGLVFSGDVRRVDRVRQGLDRVTAIRIGGNVQKQINDNFNRAYAPGVSAREIAEDIVGEMELRLGSVEAIPQNLVYEDGWTLNGSGRNALTRMLAPVGVRWYERDGAIHFTRVGSSSGGVPGLAVISQFNGMIGTPTITEDGVRVRVLMNPRMVLGRLFRIESDYINEAGGVHKITTVEHSGDNREGKFETSIEGRPVDDAPAAEGS